MEYIIATTSRKNGETLFMVDRNRQKKSFWSNKLNDVFVFKSLEKAKEKILGLKYNNPRILTAKEAITQEEKNNKYYDYDSLDDREGWDEHKLCW